ncbi:DNA-directed DNA polymerase alpha catalytic subunit pol1 [Puccinia graminis f. sp. tritici]|uniref:DNA polymerase n=2 Tax=Puccinia graminis f. sp. tritici TaxID=56615 RepID=E3KDZ8_PUCGT|nr:DNA polymerase alpha subunit A [Puccinia graminis f. sp. tritici CRL 75-36-700-3]EFP82360.2 DNA polymerase alpha subunit A [Puccinia graminis f. sp. tritici CRL 75-36-700-3]KAA1083089.1 DNA-directed DNA polymerase alpha catalytic subunit pol1 [Puccinia graminis f. sp. tritici]KAA1123977.1 DNA-directed DNA polymerase alpha catalytic subunit pol1 [Puccinia graminis f. sp. tritici]
MPSNSTLTRKQHLEALKAARAGQKRDYKASQDEAIYETVSEDQYKSIVKGRLAEDDFIENDDDSGYVDQGVNEWEEEENDEQPVKPASNHRKPRDRQSTALQSSSSGRPNSALPATSHKNTRPGSSTRAKTVAKEPVTLNAYRKTKDPVASEGFMNNLLSGLGQDSSKSSGPSHLPKNAPHQPSRLQGSEQTSDQRKRKNEPNDTRLGLSPTALRNSSPRKTNGMPSSSPPLGDEDFARTESLGDGSSAGIGGFLSSEGVEEVERISKKPRIATLHHDLVDLNVEDLAMDLSDEENLDTHVDDLKTDPNSTPTVPCKLVSKIGKHGKNRRQPPGVTVVASGQHDVPSQGNSKPAETSKPQGLNWQKALQALPTVSNIDPAVEAHLKVLIEDSEDKPQSSETPNAVVASTEIDLSETTEFLANIPRKSKTAQGPRITKKALAQAEADRHLPKPTKVDAFVPQPATDAQTTNKLTETPTENSQGNRLKFFWLDYQEAEGVIYLFGKVFDQLSAKHVACCVIVEGMQRNLFVLPRPTMVDEDGIEVKPTEDDVYDEVETVLEAHQITEFKGKLVKRKYCFEEKDMPAECDEWFKVVYSYTKPPIARLTTGKTFSKIFGTGTSAFELFLLKRKIMGPCWLDVQGAIPSTRATPASWCKLEVVVKDPKLINPLSDADSTAKEIPPLNIMSLSIRDIMNHKDNKKEIVCVTVRMWQEANLEDTTPIEQQSSVVKTFVRPLASFPAGTHEACRRSMPPITPVKEEHMLLSILLGTINSYDPDIIVGYDLANVALDVILHRMRDLKTSHWSRIGRMRREKLPSLRTGGFNNHLLTGRLVCDLSSDGFKSMVTSTTWSLTELCQKYLQITREDIDPDEIVNFFDSTSAKPDRIINFIKHCEADSYFQMALINKVQYLSLTKQLTNLAGNNWNSTLHGGRAQRNEFILLHEFHRHKFICPDKLSFNDRKTLAATTNTTGEQGEGNGGNKAIKKDKYKGGLVFEPKRGLWDKFILVMDFNSLYPSIIQEYNIDFTTVNRAGCDDDENDQIPDLPPADMKQGVLPRLIATLVNRRREVKKLMKAPDTPPSKIAQYDIKQMALKLTANSMYGCLGFEGSRFYARPLAALTTSKGREILTNTRDLAESQNLDVIYGDTDSVMINTNALDFAAANKIGNEFKKLVNERYKLLEIDIDGVFERMLLLQKKKYAALKVDAMTQARIVEVKGLDMKRREYCKLSKDASQYILEQVLSGLSTELVVEKIHEYLTELGQSVKDGKKELDDFIIHKKLGKDPKDYPDVKSQPHVQVALRMKLKGNVTPKAGDVIPYIFCLGEDGSSSTRSAQADKARHPDELRLADSPWKIDYDYYLSLQVLPPIERMCDPIEGTDRCRLAECLGLDPSRFKNIVATGQDSQREFHTLDSQIPDTERFSGTSPFEVRCRHCGEKFEFKGAQADTVGMISPSGLNCPNLECRKPLGVPSMATQLEIQIREFIGKFYEAWLICDDAACRNRTRMMSVYGRKCLNTSMGCKGQMSYEYTDKMLYNQLLYFHSLFDPSKAESKFKDTSKSDMITKTLLVNQQALATMRGIVNRYLQQNARRFVAMDTLFSFMTIRGL